MKFLEVEVLKSAIKISQVWVRIFYAALHNNVRNNANADARNIRTGA